MTAVKIGIVGCGAVVQLNYVPALRTLVEDGRAKVTAVVDPDAGRRRDVARAFVGAREYDGIDVLTAEDVNLAVVASPAKFHAKQVVQLLEKGIHVLCEKPLAVTTVEAEAMVAASRRTQSVLAVGMFRRFFPALQTIRLFLVGETFGPLRRFEVQEGGPFAWPAATPSFFDPRQAGGGVLLDAGVHVLDVLEWWLGDPSDFHYTDDAVGGLESTCRLQLTYPSQITGSILLSRDWKTANCWCLEFEKAEVIWRVGEADRLEIRPRGNEFWLVSNLEKEMLGGRVAADSYQQAFTRQMLDVIAAVAQRRLPNVPGEEALRSLRLIEQCYGARYRQT